MFGMAIAISILAFDHGFCIEPMFKVFAVRFAVALVEVVGKTLDLGICGLVNRPLMECVVAFVFVFHGISFRDARLLMGREIQLRYQPT